MGLSRLHFTRVALTGLVSNLPFGISSANWRVLLLGIGNTRAWRGPMVAQVLYIYRIPAVESESLVARARADLLSGRSAIFLILSPPTKSLCVLSISPRRF